MGWLLVVLRSEELLVMIIPLSQFGWLLQTQPPADSPKMVTLEASPPKVLILLETHFKAFL